MSINDRILELLLNDEEITWRSILTNLVKTEGLNPWDVNIISLSDKFIDTIRKLKELDFRVSGKIVLAAAILLRIKSVHLVTNDVASFDLMMATSDDLDDDEDDIIEEGDGSRKFLINSTLDKFGIVPRTPLPRKRKVSIYDLIDALENAIDSKNKKVSRIINDKSNVKFKKLMERNVDITLIIQEIYGKLMSIYGEFGEEVPFEKLLPSNKELSKRDKILTFLPLLHLETKRKVLINQESTFSPIRIKMLSDDYNNEDSDGEENE